MPSPQPASLPNASRAPAPGRSLWRAGLTCLAVMLAGGSLQGIVFVVGYPGPVGQLGGIDVTGNGIADFSFSYSTLSTMDVPSSGSTTFTSIQGVGDNRVLGYASPIGGSLRGRLAGLEVGDTVPGSADLNPDFSFLSSGALAFSNWNISGETSFSLSFGNDLTEAFLPFLVATPEGGRVGYFHFSLAESWSIPLLNEAGELAFTLEAPALLLLGWSLASESGEALTIVPIPEPGLLPLMLLGGALFAVRLRSRSMAA